MMTENEVDLFVRSLVLPPPIGFTDAEKKQILDRLAGRSSFIECAEAKNSPHTTRTFFTYAKENA